MENYKITLFGWVKRPGGTYSIRLKDLEIIFYQASAMWASHRPLGRPRSEILRLDYVMHISGWLKDRSDERVIIVHDKYITIGCQKIYRDELTAFAKKRGWKYPVYDY